MSMMLRVALATNGVDDALATNGVDDALSCGRKWGKSFYRLRKWSRVQRRTHRLVMENPFEQTLFIALQPQLLARARTRTALLFHRISRRIDQSATRN
nr:hypothetical protein Iba_chr02bCG9730 [Ipomoea batatas]